MPYDFATFLFAIIGAPFLVINGMSLYLKGFLAGVRLRSPAEVGIHAFQTFMAIVVIPLACFSLSLTTITLNLGINMCCQLVTVLFYFICWMGIWWHEIRLEIKSPDPLRNFKLSASMAFLILLLWIPSEIMQGVDVLYIGIVLFAFVRGSAITEQTKKSA